MNEWEKILIFLTTKSDQTIKIPNPSKQKIILGFSQNFPVKKTKINYFEKKNPLQLPVKLNKFPCLFQWLYQMYFVSKIFLFIEYKTEVANIIW
jgi:hypothetical protein